MLEEIGIGPNDHFHDPAFTAEVDQSTAWCADVSSTMVAALGSMFIGKETGNTLDFIVGTKTLQATMEKITSRQQALELIGYLGLRELKAIVRTCGGAAEFIRRVHAGESIPCPCCDTDPKGHPNDE